MPLPQRTSVRSEPIVRTQAGAKSMSLSQLKPREEIKKESPQTNVDVSGLRKALDEALKEGGEERKGEKKSQEKKVIGPGETVKF